MCPHILHTDHVTKIFYPIFIFYRKMKETFIVYPILYFSIEGKIFIEKYLSRMLCSRNGKKRRGAWTNYFFLFSKRNCYFDDAVVLRFFFFEIDDSFFFWSLKKIFFMGRKMHLYAF